MIKRPVESGWSGHAVVCADSDGGDWGRARESPPGLGIISGLPVILPRESHCGRRARTYRERTFRWSTVSVPMESFSMRASRTRKRPMSIAPTAIAPIAAAPRANAPTASPCMAVLPVSITSLALFVSHILSLSTSSHSGITTNSELDRQELRSRHMRPISAKMRQQVVSPRLHRYRTPCPNACE